MAKRKMKRRPQRRLQEFEDKHGVSYSGMINRLKDTIRRREIKITRLETQLEELKVSYKKEIHTLGVEHRRQLRKAETKLRNSEKKYRDFQKRKGIRHRTVIHKTKYEHYEHPSQVKTFEKRCIDLMTESKSGYLISFENIVKYLTFLDDYNKDNGTSLTLLHYIVLLNAYLLKEESTQGFTPPRLYLPQYSPHQLRTSLVGLAEAGFLNRLSKSKFQINLIGEGFLKDITNFNSYGKSNVVEALKKGLGYFEE